MGCATAIIAAAVISAGVGLFAFFLNHINRLIETRTAPSLELAFRTNHRMNELTDSWAEKWAETDKQVALLHRDLDWLLEDEDDA